MTLQQLLRAIGTGLMRICRYIYSEADNAANYGPRDSSKCRARNHVTCNGFDAFEKHVQIYAFSPTCNSADSKGTPHPPIPQYPFGFFARYCW